MTALERIADEWNQAHPIGTPVTYWTGLREGNGKYAITRSEAQVFGGHTPGLWVTGESSWIALTHVDAVRVVGSDG